MPSPITAAPAPAPAHITSTARPQNPRIPFTVRRAAPRDAPAIATLGAAIFARWFGYSLPPADLAAYLAAHQTAAAARAEICGAARTMFVATAAWGDVCPRVGAVADGVYVPGGGGKQRPADDVEVVVGFLLLTRGSSEPCLAAYEASLIELQRFYVHWALHGTGIGKALAAAAESLAREEGFRYMWLGVWEENLASQSVYAKMGYRQVGTHPFKMGSCIQLDHVMVKEL